MFRPTLENFQNENFRILYIRKDVSISFSSISYSLKTTLSNRCLGQIWNAHYGISSKRISY